MKGIAIDHTTVFKNAESLAKLFALEPHPEKQRILAFLNSREPMAVAAGIAVDIMTGKFITALAAYEFGGFYWQTDTIHYFEKYNLALDPEFIRLALADES